MGGEGRGGDGTKFGAAGIGARPAALPPWGARASPSDTHARGCGFRGGGGQCNAGRAVGALEARRALEASLTTPDAIQPCLMFTAHSVTQWLARCSTPGTQAGRRPATPTAALPPCRSLRFRAEHAPPHAAARADAAAAGPAPGGAVGWRRGGGGASARASLRRGGPPAHPRLPPPPTTHPARRRSRPSRRDLAGMEGSAAGRPYHHAGRRALARPPNNSPPGPTRQADTGAAIAASSARSRARRKERICVLGWGGEMGRGRPGPRARWGPSDGPQSHARKPGGRRGGGARAECGHKPRRRRR
jgi:hypothetical protein